MKKVSIEEYNLLFPELKSLADEIKDIVSESVKYDPNKPHDIIKIPVTIRYKEFNSFYEKAYFREKKYQNPVIEITDKVGVRFVVLLPNQINILKKVILDNPKWDKRVDKDINIQINDNPNSFDYLSTHIIIKRKNGLKFTQDSVTCEVQIRTLTQHAYSELTHDLVYKSPVNVSNPIKRNVARCMALIDTTDQIFGDTSTIIDKDIKAFHLKLEESIMFCNKHNLKIEIVKRISSHIYNNLLPVIKKVELKDFVSDEVFLHKLKLVNDIDNIYFKQPLTVFLVATALKFSAHLLDNWQIDDEVKSMLFVTLGISKAK